MLDRLVQARLQLLSEHFYQGPADRGSADWVLPSDKPDVDADLRLPVRGTLEDGPTLGERAGQQVRHHLGEAHGHFLGVREEAYALAGHEVKVKFSRGKRFTGIDARVSTKLLVHTIKQLVNYYIGKPLNGTQFYHRA